MTSASLNGTVGSENGALESQNGTPASHDCHEESVFDARQSEFEVTEFRA